MGFVFLFEPVLRRKMFLIIDHTPGTTEVLHRMSFGRFRPASWWGVCVTGRCRYGKAATASSLRGSTIPCARKW
jgi:hypothetical protein